MKNEILNEELRKANKGLQNAHRILELAIINIDAQDEDYYFQAVNRYAELVNDLQKQIKKLK